MFLFPSFHMCNREEKIGVLRAFARHVDHARRREELLDRDIVRCVVGIILSRHPVHRRVKMRAGMFAAREIVPIPGGPAAVVARNLLELERPGFPEFWRQLDGRSGCIERLAQIHDTNRPGTKGLEKLHQYVTSHVRLLGRSAPCIKASIRYNSQNHEVGRYQMMFLQDSPESLCRIRPMALASDIGDTRSRREKWKATEGSYRDSRAGSVAFPFSHAIVSPPQSELFLGVAPAIVSWRIFCAFRSAFGLFFRMPFEVRSRTFRRAALNYPGAAPE